MDPRVLLIAAVGAGLYVGGAAVVHGVKRAGHAIGHAVVHVVHSHKGKKPAPPKPGTPSAAEPQAPAPDLDSRCR